MSKQLFFKQSLTALTQGSTLSIRSRVPLLNIIIQPSWRESGHLSVFQSATPTTPSYTSSILSQQQTYQPSSVVNVSITQKTDTITSLGRSEAHILVELDPINDTDVGDEATRGVSVVAQIPEKLNLSCHLEKGGDICVDKKVEGDVELITNHGDILLNKVRGYHIALRVTNGTIYSSDVLEAQSVAISSQFGRVRAKRIHGSKVDVRVKQEKMGEPMDTDDDGAAIDISSLYISGSGSANLEVMSSSDNRTSIRCKSHHGHVNAQAIGRIELGGVNGSFDVDCEGEASVHIDSLAPDSISVVSTDEQLILTLDRKLVADLRLLSGQTGIRKLARSVLLEDDATALEQGLRQYDENHSAVRAEPISVCTSAFTDVPLQSISSFRHLHYTQGYVDNRSHEPDSRFELKGGKIRLEGATSQALQSFTTSVDDAVNPMVVGTCAGRIEVESLSWMGAISRRYGLDETERKSDLGRQATRRGRPLVVGEEPPLKD